LTKVQPRSSTLKKLNVRKIKLINLIQFKNKIPLKKLNLTKTKKKKNKTMTTRVVFKTTKTIQ
jgi:hypothetical protein